MKGVLSVGKLYKLALTPLASNLSLRAAAAGVAVFREVTPGRDDLGRTPFAL
jgi:hypothetical protein